MIISQITFRFAGVKGNLQSKKVKVKWKSVKNAKETSHHRPQFTKWFSRYSISKSGIWERWTSLFCRFSASFSIKYDVTDAILQDIQKLKVQYLRSLLFDLFETLQAVRTWQRNFASFQNEAKNLQNGAQIPDFEMEYL